MPDYVAFFLQHAAASGSLKSMFTGTTIKHLPKEKLQLVLLPIAPFGEQQRIVTAVEEAFSKLDAGEAGLHKVRQLLKRMRESILTAAVTGRLIHRGPNELCETDRRSAERLERLIEVKLPNAWDWVQTVDVLEVPLANGRSVRDRPGGFPVLRLTCLRNGSVDRSECKAGEWNEAEAASYLIEKGDFLVSRGNGSLRLVGRGGLVVDESPAVAFPDTLIRLRTKQTLMNPRFLELVWASSLVRNVIESKARTTAGIYKINQAMIEEIELPLPPLREQDRIVLEVERECSFLNDCERTIDTGLARSAALRRSILKAAFEGKLVAQDPRDEPAAALLERIRAERAAAPATKRRARKSA